MKVRQNLGLLTDNLYNQFCQEFWSFKIFKHSKQILKMYLSCIS